MAERCAAVRRRAAPAGQEAPAGRVSDPTKIPAGHLFLDGLPRGSYQASLDLGTAVAFFSQKGTTILRAFLCMGRPVGVLMLSETYRDATLTVERPSFGNGTQAAEAGNSVSPGSLQQLALPDAIPETEDGMIGFSQKVDDRTAYTLLCKKCGTTLYYTAVQAENVEKASQLAKLELCAAEDMGAEKLLQQHKRWWQQYWGKSSLQLPDETLEQLWYRANYFLAAGSEPGNAPMPLQGVWCADDDQLPPWKGDYHNDLNTQFTYCHYLTANHSEQGKVFLDYLDFLKKNNFKGHINITGGEPFIHPDFFKVISMFEENNITFGILTNGTFLNEEKVQKLSSYKKLSFVQISLDGTRRMHDEIRGDGNFKKAINGIRLLNKYNIQSMAAFTAHKKNIHKLRAVIRLCKREKVKVFWADRLIPTNSYEDMLSTEEFLSMAKLLQKESVRAKESKRCVTDIRVNRALMFLGGSNTIYHCSAGINLLTILANGDLLPCRRMPIVIGNTLENSIINLCESSSVIKALKDKYKNLNIVPIEYDPGSSEVNQINRIKLMLALGKTNDSQEIKDYFEKGVYC